MKRALFFLLVFVMPFASFCPQAVLSRNNGADVSFMHVRLGDASTAYLISVPAAALIFPDSKVALKDFAFQTRNRSDAHPWFAGEKFEERSRVKRE